MKIKSLILITLFLFSASLVTAQGGRAAGPVPRAVVTTPSGTFVASRVVHSVKVDGRNGVMIYVNFKIKNALDYPYKMIAYFYNDTDGKALAAGAETKYRTTTKFVSAVTNFKPGHVDAVYKDLKIFIPYEALNLGARRGDIFDLKYNLAMYNDYDKSVTAKSTWYKFSVQF